MSLITSLRQLLLENLLAIMAIGGVGMLYQIGTVWYENAQIITSAYGLPFI